jgi:Protein of unknown function (DUF3224)
MTRVMGEFNVMHWDERSYDDAAGQPTLKHAAVTHELTGDIEGEVSITYLMGYAPNGMARFVGLARVTGRVAEREGTFVMQDVGTFENGVAKGRWTILPGLGSGDLTGIRGDGHFASSTDSASYMLDVEL